MGKLVQRREGGRVRYCLEGVILKSGDFVEVKLDDGSWAEAQFEEVGFPAIGLSVPVFKVLNYLNSGFEVEFDTNRDCRWPSW